MIAGDQTSPAQSKDHALLTIELAGRLGFPQVQLQARDEQIKALQAPTAPMSGQSP